MTAADPAAFRRHAHAVADWMADYLDRLRTFPVRSQVRPGEIAAALPPAAPERGEPFDRLLEDLEHLVLPGITHWQHPAFFAFFPAHASPPSVLAEMVTAALAAQCMLWETSPAANELETRVVDWLRDAMGLPPTWRGVLQDTASTATLCALVAARERATGGLSNRLGLAGLGTLTTYASAEAHSSVEKGVGVVGLGREHLRKVPTVDFAMNPESLDAMMASDRAAGRLPTCVVATLGTTGAGAIDPLRRVAEVCRRHQAWLHVDAAWAGSALILPEWRWMADGAELADSFVFNPHKWLATQFDCSVLWVGDADAYVSALSIQPAYLQTRAGPVVDHRDWGIALGRRFRALKLWFVLRSYGLEGLRALVRDHIAWARELEAQVAAEADFEVVAPCAVALFAFRHLPGPAHDVDDHNLRLVEVLNASGALYLTSTLLSGCRVVRFQVGSLRTTRDDVQGAWARIRDTARALDTP